MFLQRFRSLELLKELAQIPRKDVCQVVFCVKFPQIFCPVRLFIPICEGGFDADLIPLAVGKREGINIKQCLP